MIKLAIVGGRDFFDYASMCRSLADILDVELVISGGARGADSLARIWAKDHNIPIIEHLPDWGKFGKKAGFVRNELIISDATHVVAFWNGKSRGTKSSIDLAIKYKKRYRIVNY